MSTRIDRAWMYERLDNEGYLSSVYCDSLRGFLDFAFSNKEYVERKTMGTDIVLRIRCPCRKCKNRHYTVRDDVELHLLQHGFVPDYWTWWAHGERNVTYPHVGQSSNPIEDDDVDGCTQMVLDNLHPASSFPRTWEEQAPNESAQGFYDMLADADVPLWDGCQNYSKLQAATRLLNWKSEFNITESAYNQLLPIIQDMLPDNHHLVGNFYETKKLLKKLALPKEKIDACKNHCMLFYKDDSCLTNCRVCGESRYKSGRNHVPNLVLTYMPIAPRLQRLYMCKKTSKEMTWHYDHQTELGKMVHPSDGEAWKHFDLKDPVFAEEIRNVRLGLCTDGFSPNNSNSTPYSLWPVFLTIYNLPPWMALKDSYVKVAMVIPGKKNRSEFGRVS